jgi:hypothetical protein
MSNVRRAGAAVIAAGCLLATGARAQVDFGTPDASLVGIFDTGRATLCEMDGINGPDLVFSSDSAAGFDYAVLLNNGSC